MTENSDITDLQLGAVAQLAYALAPGKLGELREFLQRAVPNRIPAKVAYEIVLQSYLFFGYAQAIEAAKIFASAGLREATDPVERPKMLSRSALIRRGEALCSKIYAPNFERLVENMRRVSPELAEWMVVEGYGRVLSREGPTECEREVASIVFLICSGHPVQLYSHVRGARNLGITRDQLKAVLRAVSFDSEQRELLENTIAKVYEE